jgi:mersacidin/lichenicidin family type 2 lantibiotic
MLIDEILRALRDPEYRAQLTAEARGAMPDRPIAVAEYAEPEAEGEGES